MFFCNEKCEKMEQFMENIETSETLLESFNIAYNKLTITNNSTVILKTSTFFGPLESPYSTILAKEQSITKSTPFNDKKIGALQYLAGYVVKKIKLKVLSDRDYKLDLNQSWVKIMDHAKVEGNYGKLIE